MRNVLLLPFLVLLNVVNAQDAILYGDWIDSVNVAKTNKDPASAQRFYHAAFKRSTPVVKHALDCARISWLLHDTVDCQAYANLSLDLGISGPDMAVDSVLSDYWRSAASTYTHKLWDKYKAMELPELKAELEAMFKKDQDIRKTIDWDKADSPDTLVRRPIWRPVEALDQAHTERVIQIINERGVPSIHQVGLTGNKMIFFAFIHANEVQAIIGDYSLQLSESVKRGDSPARWYAYIVDRIMSNTSKETMFGTTGYTDYVNDTSNFIPVSSKYVDLLREEMGLPRMREVRSSY
ncbi:MAG: DUF6624 domain-containing protein [Flavobacteriales bacterium]